MILVLNFLAAVGHTCCWNVSMIHLLVSAIVPSKSNIIILYIWVFLLFVVDYCAEHANPFLKRLAVYGFVLESRAIVVYGARGVVE